MVGYLKLISEASEALGSRIWPFFWPVSLHVRRVRASESTHVRPPSWLLPHARPHAPEDKYSTDRYERTWILIQVQLKF